MKKLIITSFLFLNLGVFSLALFGQESIQTNGLTADKVIKNIIRETKALQIPNTVDVIKEGNPGTVVTGIATCMFATMDVLKEAVQKNCNLIIAHEPLYYNHLDDTKKLANDPVFLEKKHFINEHKLVIWRFHDYIHTMKPDGIVLGMIDKLGWKTYVAKDDLNQFHIPETTLKGLIESLKHTFPATTFYIVGNPAMKLTNIRLAEGAPGSEAHIRQLERQDVDVLIAGEAQQWETYEYVRDAVQQGKHKAIIFLGHIPSEEAGMQWCSTWLKTFIKDVPVTYIECGSSYWAN